MVPAAVYPIPSESETAVLVVLFLITVAVPLYVLLMRPLHDRRAWGLGEMAAMAILFMIALPLAAMMLGIEFPLSLFDLSLVTVVQNAVLVSLPAYVAVVRYRLPPSALGLSVGRWRRVLLWGVVATVPALIVAIAGEQVALYVLGLIEGPRQASLRAAVEHADDPLLPVLATLSGVGPIAWFFTLLAVIVPLGEEVFFRGFVYGGLRARWGVPIAALASALFFSAVHLQVVHGFPIFLLGLILAWLYERNGSLVPAVIAHALNNVIAVLSLWKGWGI